MTFSTKVLSAFLTVAAAGCASTSGVEPARTPIAGGVAAVAAAEPTPEVAAPAAPGSASFTAVQADRGRDSFRGNCTECHYSSEFSDAEFKFKWSKRSAGNLYALIQTSMPESAPGSLSPEEAVQLVAYILRMNGFEAGSSELLPERAVLDAISLASIRD